MKYLIALLILACASTFVQLQPLERDREVSLDGLKDDLRKILAKLEYLDIKIPDDIQFPPRVNT